MTDSVSRAADMRASVVRLASEVKNATVPRGLSGAFVIRNLGDMNEALGAKVSYPQFCVLALCG